MTASTDTGTGADAGAGAGAFSGRSVLVTGATAGIGTAIARAFAQAGAFVVVHGRDRVAGAALAEELSGAFLHGDLADPATPARMVAELAELLPGPGLDVLVNNAGFETHADIADLGRDLLARVLEVNFVAPVELSRLLLPLLGRSDAASVLMITSIHESVPVSGNTAYACAKAALAMFVRSAAIEWGPRGLRVNSIAPGAVETAMNTELLDEVGRDRFARWIPAGRVGQAEEVAGAALFLSSPQASYVTGASLVVDGGYSHHLVRY